MRNPTATEREHYGKLEGRKIMAVVWDNLEGEPLPLLLLDGVDREGNAATVSILADPEGNGPGFLDHNV